MRIADESEYTVKRGNAFCIAMDGQQVEAYEGETVAAVLQASGIRTLRKTRGMSLPRGVFCGIGVCYDCLVIIDKRPNQRACMTEAIPGMQVESQNGVGH